MKKNLSKYDANGNGTLNIDEFAPYLISVLKRLDKLGNMKKHLLYQNLDIENVYVSVEAIFKEADKDGNGYLDRKEFTAFMRSVCVMLHLP